MAMEAFDPASILQEADDTTDDELTTLPQSQRPVKLISQELLTAVIQSLAENQCLAEDSQRAIKNLAGQEDIHEKLSFLEACLEPRGRFPSASAERATARFHKAMSDKIAELMEGFSMTSCDVFFFCLEMFERLKEINYSEEQTQIIQCHVTSEEKDILHYIGGSIMASIKKRLTTESCDEGREAVVNCLLKDRASIESEHVSMTSMLDRGGLTYVKSGLVTTFICMEEQFRYAKTREEFTSGCLNNPSIISSYYDATYSCPASEDDKWCILQQCLKLFYKIRVHHKCKMMMDKYRLQNQISSKKKGIRKELKLASQ